MIAWLARLGIGAGVRIGEARASRRAAVGVNRDRRVAVGPVADRRALCDAWPDAGVALAGHHHTRPGREQQRAQPHRDAPVEVGLAVSVRRGRAGGVAFLLAVAVVDEPPDLQGMGEVAAVVAGVDGDHPAAEGQLLDGGVCRRRGRRACHVDGGAERLKLRGVDRGRPCSWARRAPQPLSATEAPASSAGEGPRRSPEHEPRRCLPGTSGSL